MATPYTTEQYNALVAAIASGVLTVRHGDETIEYRSFREMKELRFEMEKALGIDSNRPVRHVADFRRGH